MKKAIQKHWKKLAIGSIPFWIFYLFCLPRPLFDTPLSIVIEDKAGDLLGAQIAADGQWRFSARDTLPTNYIKAVIEFEDRRFYQHPGIDLKAIFRAVQQNIRNGRIVSGGSTISMQVIRMARNRSRRSLWNKFLEMVMATRLELAYSKEEILQYYAANAPFGGNVVGLEAASWRYYGKSAQLLSWSEAATLAVLPNSPALIHPGRNRDALEAKRNRLLDRLLASEQLDSISWELAKEEPLPEKPLPLPQLAPHLLHKMSAQYHQKKIKDARVRTSLDLSLQQSLMQRVKNHAELTQHNLIFNAAVLVLHIPSNEVVAYVANVPEVGEDHGEMVNLIDAPRSTGSILKPFLYALALEEGTILPHSLLSDTPVNYNGYRPQNFNKNFYGAIPANEALERSLNIPFVNLLKDYGLDRFHADLKRLGMQTLAYPPGHYGLTLVLGGAETSLWDITNMYAALGRTSEFYTRNSSQYLRDNFQKASFLPPDQRGTRKPIVQKDPVIFGAGAAWWTLQAMQELKRPSSEGEWEVFRSNQNIAWKTGTSFGFRDAWAVGLTPEYAVGVWVGNADGEGRPGLVGVQAAAPLLFEVFRLLPSADGFAQPFDDLKEAKICSKSGLLAGKDCPTDSLLIPAGLPSPYFCRYHHKIHLDKEGTFQVNSQCVSPLDMKHESWFVLPPLEAHFYKNYYPDYQALPPFSPDCEFAVAQQKMQLIYPREAARIYVPLDLDGELSRTVFEVAHVDEKAKLYWHIDETFIGTTTQFHSMEFNPSAGKHLLTVVDDKGDRLEQAFEIIGKEE